MSNPAMGPVLCFGEVLWDCLPQGLFPGGAPINVAYHLHQLGVPALPVTAVGRDFLGEELLRRFKRWGLSRDGVAIVDDKRTGAVLVELDPRGAASYRILEDVAWDWISLTKNVQHGAAESAALVYGSLAQRRAHNRGELERLAKMAARARMIFDVNLRAPFDDLKVVRELARSADAIKLNHDELHRLTGLETSPKGLEAAARAFADQTGCAKICVTAGSDGAGLWWDGSWTWEQGRPVQVRDTIGAGDSFLAGLIAGWLHQSLPPERMLQRACRLAEFVASCQGATPSYTMQPDGRITGEENSSS